MAKAVSCRKGTLASLEWFCPLSTWDTIHPVLESKILCYISLWISLGCFSKALLTFKLWQEILPFHWNVLYYPYMNLTTEWALEVTMVQRILAREFHYMHASLQDAERAFLIIAGIYHMEFRWIMWHVTSLMRIFLHYLSLNRMIFPYMQLNNVANALHDYTNRSAIPHMWLNLSIVSTHLELFLCWTL